MKFLENNPSNSPGYSSGKTESFLIVSTIVVFSISVFDSIRELFVVPSLLLTLLLIGFILKQRALFYISLVFFVLSFLSTFPYVRNLWPTQAFVGLLIYFLFFRRAKREGLLGWLARGKVTREIIIFGFTFIIAASIALVLWFYFLEPDVRDIKENFPKGEFWILVGAGFGFSILNAIAEEFIFRGILFESLSTIGWKTVWPLLLQAICFGFLHLHGFPRGWTGVVLASIYGLMTGFIRIKSNGILYPVLVHFFADITIATIVLFYVN